MPPSYKRTSFQLSKSINPFTKKRNTFSLASLVALGEVILSVPIRCLLNGIAPLRLYTSTPYRELLSFWICQPACNFNHGDIQNINLWREKVPQTRHLRKALRRYRLPRLAIPVQRQTLLGLSCSAERVDDAQAFSFSNKFSLRANRTPPDCPAVLIQSFHCASSAISDIDLRNCSGTYRSETNA